MKKFLAMLMAVLMVLGLAACGEADGGEADSNLTPYEVVKQASEKLDNADGVAYDMDMTMTMVTQEAGETNSFDMNMTGDIKMEKVAENDYKLAYNVTTDMSQLLGEGNTITMHMYYADGYMYYDMGDMGVKYKVAMDMTEAMETINSASFSDIEEGMVKEQSIKRDGTGQVVSLILDGTKMSDMVAAMSEEFAAFGDDAAMTIGDIPYTVYIGEGNITNIEMLMTFDMDIEGVQMNMAMDMNMGVTQVGGVTVELPEDLADYPEMSLDGNDLAA